MSAGRIFASASSDRFWRRLPPEANCKPNSRNWPPKSGATPFPANGLCSGSRPSSAGITKPSRSKAGPVEALKRKIRSDHGQHPSLSPKLRRAADRTAPAASQLELPTAFRQPGGGGGTTTPSRPDAFLCLAVALHEKPRAVQAGSPRAGPQSGSSGGRAPLSKPGRCAVTKANMSTDSGTWIFITAPCACC